MNEEETVKILITVKTYPHLSEKYRETVCTAGVTEDGSFIRLYPIDYRYDSYWNGFGKYQWVEATVKKRSKSDDPRPESYEPIKDKRFKFIGKKLNTENGWYERKKYVLANGVDTMCALQHTHKGEKSLAIIKPAEVTDFTWEAVGREWQPKHKRLFEQQRLFGPDQKPLEKIPYKFSYHYKCDDKTCNGHTMMIDDWEVAKLYLRMYNKFYDEEVACEKVKQKYYDEFCKRDLHFYVGTTKGYPTWIIIGTFTPPREERLPLFDNL